MVCTLSQQDFYVAKLVILNQPYYSLFSWLMGAIKNFKRITCVFKVRKNKKQEYKWSVSKLKIEIE